MPSQYSKQLSASGVQELGNTSRKELDDANLARMGKRPVLKVDYLTPGVSMRWADERNSAILG